MDNEAFEVRAAKQGLNDHSLKLSDSATGLHQLDLFAQAIYMHLSMLLLRAPSGRVNLKLEGRQWMKICSPCVDNKLGRSKSMMCRRHRFLDSSVPIFSIYRPRFS